LIATTNESELLPYARKITSPGGEEEWVLLRSGAHIETLLNYITLGEEALFCCDEILEGETKIRQVSLPNNYLPVTFFNICARKFVQNSNNSPRVVFLQVVL
tara:strand:- start:2987 stop:3292 length:306 start_codon:yes stop_codon:yes gene_type:complete